MVILKLEHRKVNGICGLKSHDGVNGFYFCWTDRQPEIHLSLQGNPRASGRKPPARPGCKTASRPRTSRHAENGAANVRSVDKLFFAFTWTTSFSRDFVPLF